jgi:hypothetical protein
VVRAYPLSFLKPVLIRAQGLPVRVTLTGGIVITTLKGGGLLKIYLQRRRILR